MKVSGVWTGWICRRRRAWLRTAGCGSRADLSRLLSHADLMLYRAKHDGRNCVRVYGNEPPSDPTARRA